MAWNAALTVRGYFILWPRNPEVRLLYQATWTEAARWLDVDPDTTQVAASGLKIHDLDPQTFSLLLRRGDIKIKWFDCRTSILLPGSGAMRYISPDFFPCDAGLWARFLKDARPIAADDGAEPGTGSFSVHRLEAAGLSDDREWAQFGPLAFRGAEITRPSVAPGGEARVLTIWEVADRVPAPLKIFVHVAGADGKPLAQWDGFDFGEAGLERGDRLVEQHRFTIPPDMPPGTYTVTAGVYDPATMKRWTQPNGADRVTLGTIAVP